MKLVLSALLIAMAFILPVAKGCYHSCQEAYALELKANNTPTSGIYSICPTGDNSSALTAYCDQETAGGGWMLFLAYNHSKGANLRRVNKFLPTDPARGYSHRYLQLVGYADQDDIQDLRFFCTSSTHNRTVHFTTNNAGAKEIAYTGNQQEANNSVSFWTSFTALSDHSATIPSGALNYAKQQKLGGLHNYPFGARENAALEQPGKDRVWTVSVLGYYGCDDLYDYKESSTVHNVWVRMKSNETVVTPVADEPSAAPSDVPSSIPSRAPSDVPSMIPSAGPSMEPSVVPSSTPTYWTQSIYPCDGTCTGLPPGVYPHFNCSTFYSCKGNVSYPELESCPDGELFDAANRRCAPAANVTCECPRPLLVKPVPQTGVPSSAPSENPSVVPSAQPSTCPSTFPSDFPSDAPSLRPSGSSFESPSQSPSNVPSVVPSQSPFDVPSVVPSQSPSNVPSVAPSQSPSNVPSVAPSSQPSKTPTSIPSSMPSGSCPNPLIPITRTYQFVFSGSATQADISDSQVRAAFEQAYAQLPKNPCSAVLIRLAVASRLSQRRWLQGGGGSLPTLTGITLLEEDPSQGHRRLQTTQVNVEVTSTQVTDAPIFDRSEETTFVSSFNAAVRASSSSSSVVASVSSSAVPSSAPSFAPSMGNCCVTKAWGDFEKRLRCPVNNWSCACPGPDCCRVCESTMLTGGDGRLLEVEEEGEEEELEAQPTVRDTTTNREICHKEEQCSTQDGFPGLYLHQYQFVKSHLKGGSSPCVASCVPAEAAVEMIAGGWTCGSCKMDTTEV